MATASLPEDPACSALHCHDHVGALYDHAFSLTHTLEPARANAIATLVRAQVPIVQTGNVARRQAILDGDDVVEIQLRWWPRLGPPPG